MNFGHFFCADSVGLAYLEICKSGCTSGKTLIAQLNRKDWRPPANPLDVHFDNEPFSGIFHKSRVDKLSSYFCFTFVRHPYNRFMSFYTDKILRDYDTPVWELLLPLGFKLGMSIQDTIHLIGTLDPAQYELHFAPQTICLFDGERLVVDFIGRLERGARDWETVIHRSGIPLEVPHLHKSDAPTNLPELVNAETLETFHRIYRRDFDVLGYSRSHVASSPSS